MANQGSSKLVPKNMKPYLQPPLLSSDLNKNDNATRNFKTSYNHCHNLTNYNLDGFSSNSNNSQIKQNLFEIIVHRLRFRYLRNHRSFTDLRTVNGGVRRDTMVASPATERNIPAKSPNLITHNMPKVTYQDTNKVPEDFSSKLQYKSYPPPVDRSCKPTTTSSSSRPLGILKLKQTLIQPQLNPVLNQKETKVLKGGKDNSFKNNYLSKGTMTPKMITNAKTPEVSVNQAAFSVSPKVVKHVIKSVLHESDRGESEFNDSSTLNSSLNNLYEESNIGEESDETLTTTSVHASKSIYSEKNNYKNVISILNKLNPSERKNTFLGSYFENGHVIKIASYLFLGDLEAAYCEQVLCKLNIDGLIDVSGMSVVEVEKYLTKKIGWGSTVFKSCTCPSPIPHVRAKLRINLTEGYCEPYGHHDHLDIIRPTQYKNSAFSSNNVSTTKHTQEYNNNNKRIQGVTISPTTNQRQPYVTSNVNNTNNKTGGGTESNKHNIKDIITYFEDINRFIDFHRYTGKRIMVFCKTGRGSSASTIVQYMMRESGLPLRRCYAIMKDLCQRIANLRKYLPPPNASLFPPLGSVNLKPYSTESQNDADMGHLKLENDLQMALFKYERFLYKISNRNPLLDTFLLYDSLNSQKRNWKSSVTNSRRSDQSTDHELRDLLSQIFKDNNNLRNCYRRTRRSAKMPSCHSEDLASMCDESSLTTMTGEAGFQISPDVSIDQKFMCIAKPNNNTTSLNTLEDSGCYF